MAAVIDGATEKTFLSIQDEYPHEFVLVRITDIDDVQGTGKGIALYKSFRRPELEQIARERGMSIHTVILTGRKLKHKK